jgi:hypothetical protein
MSQEQKLLENIALYLLDDADEDLLYDAISELSEIDIQVPNLGEIRNKDGSVRKVKRTDYSRTPKRVKTKDPWNSIYWLQLISDPNTNNPSHRNGKDFRRMFRTPFPVFKDIVDKCRQTNEPFFNYENKIICGEVAIPLELKILFVLRVLGSGLIMRDGAEMTNGFISNTTGTTFFKEFCKLFRRHFGDLYINNQSDESIRNSLKEYAMLGLPGCAGSMDGVFINWDMVPNEDQILCKGDKGKGK